METISSCVSTFEVYPFYHVTLLSRCKICYYNSYKFSQDLSLLLLLRNSLFKSPFATLNDPFLSLCFLWWQSGISCASSGFCFSLIWLRIPTNSSSTWWLSAADVSAYLQSYFRAVDLASVINKKTLQVNYLFIYVHFMITKRL